LSIMHKPYEGIESVAEMIARLVCEYEVRRAAEKKRAHKSNLVILLDSDLTTPLSKPVTSPLPLSPHPQLRC
jgi:hypothetical protein